MTSVTRSFVATIELAEVTCHYMLQPYGRMLTLLCHFRSVPETQAGDAVNDDSEAEAMNFTLDLQSGAVRTR